MEPENSFVKAARTGRTWYYESTPYCHSKDYSLYGDYEKHSNQPFKVGDIVCLKTGQAPQRVLEVKGHCIRCEYVSSRKQIGFRSASEFKIYTETNIEEKTIMKHTLYKVVADNRYGEFKAMDGNKALLYMKDSNTYEAFDMSAIKKVMPYTVDIVFSGKGQTYSYLANKDEFAVGDLLLTDGLGMAKVVAVDTESELANKTFTGYKLNVTKLG